MKNIQIIAMIGLVAIMAVVTDFWLPRSSNMFVAALWGIALIGCCFGLVILLFVPVFGQPSRRDKKKK